tara:strand:+ start:1422 stop:3752 length:2331 start_codon:yes stop_codon:yes gene_type:complete
MAARKKAQKVQEEPQLSEEEAREMEELLDLNRDYDEDEDPDLADLNNPDVETLVEPPLLGRQNRSTELFGDSAETLGRMTSPKLYAQAAQFPTAVQYRVWRWENGVPVALGAIDAEANEEDFIRQFYSAMPKKGDNRFQYRLRPIDIRGQELGKEFTINVSEHHDHLSRIRDRKAQEAAEEGGRGGMDPFIINQGDGAGASYAEEMGRMFEQAVDSAEKRTELLQMTLEDERNRLREQEATRAEERVNMAAKGADAVQQMTERLMESDRQRSSDQMSAQKDQSEVMMSTLTTVFQQQQAAGREQAERVRESDKQRMSQDREYFERQRQDSDRQRQRERDEWEQRQQAERLRQELEQKRMEEQRKFELQQMQLDAQRRESEMERRRQQDKEDMQLRLEREKMEMERQREQQREDRERWRQEIEAKRLEEQRVWEKKESNRRDEREQERGRRQEEILLQQKQMEVAAQRDRDHAERMMEMAKLEREAQRDAQLQREKSEREGREVSERERARQHDLAMKEMHLNKERDREHSERMMQLSKAQASGGLSGITDMLGMDTSEVLARVFGGGGEGGEGGWADAIPKVLGSIAEIGKAAATAKQPAPVEGKRRRRLPVTAVPQPRPAMQAHPGHPVPSLPDMPFIPPGMEEAAESPRPTPPEPAKVEERHVHPLKAAKKVDTLSKAKESGIKLATQKKARKRIRKLVEKLDTSPREEWDGLIIAAIVEEVDIYHYINAVSLYSALAEAGSSQEMADDIASGLRANEGVPKNFPYTPKDLEEK